MEEIKANLILRRKMLLIELQSINEQLRVLETPTTVIDVPESESLKTATSPVQTASGKDSTNPLKAEVLLKNLDNTGLGSLNLNSKLAYANPFTFGKSKITKLATNTLVQEQVFKPNYLQAAKSNQERFYVIYKGPRAGIYTNWGEVHRICQEDKSTNKKFSNLEQAQMEFHLHGDHGEKTKTNPIFLRPKISQRSEKIRKNIEIKESRSLKNQLVLNQLFTTKNSFCYGTKPGQHAKMTSYMKRFYTTTKHQRVCITSLKEQISRLIYQLSDGLVYKTSIQMDHEDNYSPYTFMEIGLAKPNKELQFSKVMEDKIRKPHKTGTEEDINLLNQFGLPFLKNTIEAKGTTKEAYCRQARQLFEEHSCNYCIESKKKESGPHFNKSGPLPLKDESSSD
ncbi:Orf y [Tanacetum coccineum]